MHAEEYHILDCTEVPHRRILNLKLYMFNMGFDIYQTISIIRYTVVLQQNIPLPSKLLNLDVSITPNRLYHFRFRGGFKGVNSSPVSTVVEDILGFLFCGRGRITATLAALLD